MKLCPKCNESHIKPGIFCSRTCANSRGPRSDEFKKQQSLWAKNNPRGAILNKQAQIKGGESRTHQRGLQITSIIPFRCTHCKTIHYKKSNSKSKYCSLKCYRSSGNSGGLHPNSTRVHRSVYKGFKMDSGAELAFAKLLDSHKIHWIKNSSKYFTFVDSSGKSRKYYPDFYLPDFDFWVEIKGRKYVRQDDDLRIKAVGENIELMFSHELRLPNCIGGSKGIEPLCLHRQCSIITNI